MQKQYSNKLKGNKKNPLVDLDKIKTEPSKVFIIRRALIWIFRLTKIRIKFSIQKIKKKDTPEWKAVQIRLLMQQGGTVSLKLGQQLSLRTDKLDPALCHELKKLLDKVPPMPTELSIAIIEKSIGSKIYEVFSSFDPSPIGSGSISCVYKAHLISGGKVAVKVLRILMLRELKADLKIIRTLASKMEGWNLVQKGSLTDTVDELIKMLMEETDFNTEAIYTNLFKKDTKDLNYVTAPKIYHKFTKKEILVIEFCEGCFLVDILRAVEKDDKASLENLERKGLDLEKVATRLSHLLYWELFESEFFHADPHPANIIVKPNNKLILIDFGSCGSISSGLKKSMQDFMDYSLEGDIEGMAKCMLATAEPLPAIDIEAYLSESKQLMRDWYFRQRSKQAKWFEKTSAAAFFDSMGQMGKYNIRTNPELVRHARANMLFDTMIYRLKPKLEMKKVYRKYLTGMYKRKTHQTKKEMRLREKQKDKLLDADYLKMQDQIKYSNELIRSSSKLIRRPRYRFLTDTSKESQVSSSFINAGFSLVKLFTAFVIGRLIYSSKGDWRNLISTDSLMEGLTNAFTWTINSPYFYLIAAFVFLSSIKKISTLLEKRSIKNVITDS